MKNRIKYIIMLFILCISSVWSSTLTYEYSGDLSIDSTTSKVIPIYGREKGSTTNRLELTVNNDYYYKNNRITISPTYFETDDNVYNSLAKKPITKKRLLFLNEFYYEYLFNNTYSLSVGVFPYKKGTFYEYSFNGVKMGNGLYNLVSLTLEGAILTYKKENNIINIAALTYDGYFKSYYDFYKDVDNDMSDMMDWYIGTKIYNIIDKYTAGKWYYEFNYYYIDHFAYDRQLLHSDLYGLGISYDNEEYDGSVTYAILSISDTKGDNTYLSPTGGFFENDSAYFGPFDEVGYNILIGYKKEFDRLLFNKDISAGLEYVRTGRGYYSLSVGKPIAEHAYGDLANTYIVNIGLRLNKDSIIKLRVSKMDSIGYVNKNGGSVVSTNIENVRNSVEHTNTVSVQWYYSF